MTDIVEISNDSFVLLEEQTISVVSEGTQGPQGIQGNKGEKGETGGSLIERVAGIDISGHRFVSLDEQGRAVYASNTNLADATRLVGLTTNAAVEGDVVALQIYDDITEPSWNWELNKPLYLGADGHLTQVQPTFPSAKFMVVVGFPISATKIFINIGIPISLT